MKYFGILIAIIFISCNNNDDHLCQSNGDNFITYGLSRIDSSFGGLMIYDKISDEFYYTFLIGKGTIKYDDYDISEFKSSSEYLRLSIKADSLMLNDRRSIYGSYDLIDNDLNILCYYDSDGVRKVDKITEGKVKLGIRCPYNHLLSLEFEGQALTQGEIFAESYIQGLNYSSKFYRKVKGTLVYGDMNLELSMADRNDYDPITKLEFVDYNSVYYCSLSFYIHNKSKNLTGQYIYDREQPENSFLVRFTMEDFASGNIIEEDFKGGELVINQENNEYELNFTLFTKNDYNINGNWDGEIN